MSVTKNHSLHLDSASYTKDQNIMKFMQKLCKLKLLIYPHSLQETGGLILFLKSSNCIQTHERLKKSPKSVYENKTQLANFQGNPLYQATKWHLKLNNR